MEQGNEGGEEGAQHVLLLSSGWRSIIVNNGTQIKKNSDVLPQGYTVLQEDTSIAVGINSLLEVLENFQNMYYVHNYGVWKEEETVDNTTEIFSMQKKQKT